MTPVPNIVDNIVKLPGDPLNDVKGGTTVSGGRTVLSAMAQQSFNTQRRPYVYVEGILDHIHNTVLSKCNACLEIFLAVHFHQVYMRDGM